MGGVGGVGGFTVIIMQVSVQIGLNWNWPTGTELGNMGFFVRNFWKFLKHYEANLQ